MGKGAYQLSVLNNGTSAHECVGIGPTNYFDLLLPEPAKVIKVNMIDIRPIMEIVPTLMSLPDDTILGNIIAIVINAPIHKIANIAFIS